MFFFLILYINLSQNAKQYVPIPKIVAFEHLWPFLRKRPQKSYFVPKATIFHFPQVTLNIRTERYLSMPKIVSSGRYRKGVIALSHFSLAVLSEQNRRFIIYRWISKSNGSKYSCSKVEYDAQDKIHIWRISIVRRISFKIFFTRSDEQKSHFSIYLLIDF